MTTYHGLVKTPFDAILLFEACRVGILPRVQHRLSDRDRAGIAHGCVYVWDEREAAIRRWTDGKSWSASRVFGAFLTYRETYGDDNRSSSTSSNSSSNSSSSSPAATVKPNGLMRYSLLVETTSGQKLHLVSYVSSSIDTEELTQPSSDPILKGLDIQYGLYPDSLVPNLHRQQLPHHQCPQSIFNTVNGAYLNPVQYIPRQLYSPPTVSVYPPVVCYPVQHLPIQQQAPIMHHTYTAPPHNHQHFPHYQHAPIPYHQPATAAPVAIINNKDMRSDLNNQLNSSQGYIRFQRVTQKRSPVQKTRANNCSKSVVQRRLPTTAAVPVAATAWKAQPKKHMSKSRSTNGLSVAVLAPLTSQAIIKLPVLSLPLETSRVAKSGIDARAIKVLNRKFTL